MKANEFKKHIKSREGNIIIMNKSFNFQRKEIDNYTKILHELCKFKPEEKLHWICNNLVPENIFIVSKEYYNQMAW